MKSVVAVAGLAGADGARQAGVNTTDAPSVSPCGTAPHTLVIPTNAQFAGARGDRSEPFVGRGRQRNMDPVKKIMSFRLRRRELLKSALIVAAGASLPRCARFQGSPPPPFPPDLPRLRPGPKQKPSCRRPHYHVSPMRPSR